MDRVGVILLGAGVLALKEAVVAAGAGLEIGFGEEEILEAVVSEAVELLLEAFCDFVAVLAPGTSEEDEDVSWFLHGFVMRMPVIKVWFLRGLRGCGWMVCVRGAEGSSTRISFSRVTIALQSGHGDKPFYSCCECPNKYH